MKSRLLFFLLIAQVGFLSGCSKNNNLKNDASAIADAMCSSIQIMNDLKVADQADTARINDLHLRYQEVQENMEKLYSDFRKKYDSRLKDPGFSKEFSRELRKAILTCTHLSKEDREKYEKEVE